MPMLGGERDSDHVFALQGGGMTQALGVDADGPLHCLHSGPASEASRIYQALIRR